MNRGPVVTGVGGCLLALLLGCRSSERDYEKAAQANTIEAYDEFLAQHPKADSAPEAKRRLSELVGERSYRYKSGYKGVAGAHKVTVQSTTNGLQVRAGSVTFLSRPGREVKMTPGDARLSFVMGEEIEFDGASFGFASFVSLQFQSGVVLPARLLLRSDGQGLQASGIRAVFPDAAKSAEVSLVIDPAVGATAYAGLRFGSPVVVGINEDGRVQVNHEGITATDSSGALWASRSLAADGSPPFVLIRR